jgi:hypothetical protein
LKRCEICTLTAWHPMGFTGSSMALPIIAAAAHWAIRKIGCC